jgi:hypothetical protein
LISLRGEYLVPPGSRLYIGQSPAGVLVAGVLDAGLAAHTTGSAATATTIGIEKQRRINKLLP